MIDFVGTPPFRRIALWAAMETMHLNIARITLFVRTIFEAIHGVPKNNLTYMKTSSGVAWYVKIEPRYMI